MPITSQARAYIHALGGRWAVFTCASRNQFHVPVPVTAASSAKFDLHLGSKKSARSLSHDFNLIKKNNF